MKDEQFNFPDNQIFSFNDEELYTF